MSAPRFAVALFDLDGTLTDPRIGITRSYQHALATVGTVVDDPDELVWMIGPPLRANLVAAGLHGADVDTAAAAYRDRHRTVGVYEVTVVPGIPELLADLHAAGTRLGLATGKVTDQGAVTLDHFGMAPWFDVVVGSDLDRGRIEKDDIVRHALDELGSPPVDRCGMVGDRRFDIEGAKAAGLTSIGVTWGYAQPGELAAAAPDLVADTVDELRAFLLSIP
jgi:phosphoglycolate phosphatase